MRSAAVVACLLAASAAVRAQGANRADESARVPDEICGFSVVPPQAWGRAVGANGSVTIGPTGLAPGKVCVVTFVPVQEHAGTAQQWHDSLWQGMTTGLNVVSASTATLVGAFLVKTGVVADASGTKQWITLHTALAGKRGGAALYLSNSEDLFKTHAGAVRTMIENASFGGVAPASRPKRLSDLMDIKLEDRWTARGDGGDWTQLVPPGVSNLAESCAAVRGGIPIEGTWWASHRKMWNGLRDELGMKDLEPVLQNADGPGDFIMSSGTWGTRETSARVRLYTARAGQSLVAVLWSGQNYGTWSLQTWPLERMLRAAVVKGGTSRVPLKIVEAWQCVRVQTTNALDAGVSKAQIDRIVLFENGLADFSVKHDEGYDSAPLAKMDPELNDPAFGAWTAAGNEVRITRGGTTDVYTREGDRLRRGQDSWQPMLRVDGLRLSGRFGRQSGPSDPIQFHQWIEFSAEGRFRMSNILWERIVEGQRLRPPETGSGTYEIRNWTLHLKLDGGFEQSQDFLILEGDVKKPGSIRLRTVLFPREE